MRILLDERLARALWLRWVLATLLGYTASAVAGVALLWVFETLLVPALRPLEEGARPGSFTPLTATSMLSAAAWAYLASYLLVRTQQLATGFYRVKDKRHLPLVYPVYYLAIMFLLGLFVVGMGAPIEAAAVGALLIGGGIGVLLGMFQMALMDGYDRLQRLHWTFTNVIAWALGALASIVSYTVAGGVKNVGPGGLLVLSNVPALLVAGFMLFFVVSAITGISVAMLLTNKQSGMEQQPTR